MSNESDHVFTTRPRSLLDQFEYDEWQLNTAITNYNQSRSELEFALAHKSKLTEEEALFLSRRAHRNKVLDEVFYGVRGSDSPGPELTDYRNKHG